MNYVELNNGIKMPNLGIGTFMLQPTDAENSVREALKIGYRLIDTANAYVNERAVGRGIKESGVPREEIFVSTKLWPTEYENPTAVDETLERLGLNYIDLLFLHQPGGNYKEGYKQLEKAYKEGKIKAIGISNFFGKDLERLLANIEIMPQVSQVERHPLFTGKSTNEDESFLKHNMKIMSWFPLCRCDKRVMKSDIIINLSKKYNKSVQQIVIRWHIQKGYIPIPGSTKAEHIRDNFNVFDFELIEEDMKEIERLDIEYRFEKLKLLSRIFILFVFPIYERKK